MCTSVSTKVYLGLYRTWGAEKTRVLALNGYFIESAKRCEERLQKM